jgi:hypothetical protein
MTYQDMVDPRSVHIVNTFEDILAWPIQAGIERVEMNPRDGINVFYGDTSMWPDHNLDNSPTAGLVRFTLCAGFQIGGFWIMSAFFEFWAHSGRNADGSVATPRHDSGAHPLLNDPVWKERFDIDRSNWLTNWADPTKGYGALSTFTPQPGQLMAMFLAAGSARMRKHRTVAGRSQIVTFPLVLNGEQSFAPDGETTPPVPAPTDPDTGNTMTEIELLNHIRDEIILNVRRVQEEEAQKATERFNAIDERMARIESAATAAKEQLERGFSTPFGTIRPVQKK